MTTRARRGSDGIRGALPRLLALCLAFASGASGAACHRDDGGITIRVSAASSLTDVLQDLGRRYAEGRAGVRVVLNFGGSALLARQILMGAPADVFLPADEVQLRRVRREGRVESARLLLKNRLVVVARGPAGDGAPRSGLSTVLAEVPGPVAIGGEAVPAGRYARRYLRRSKLLDAVRSRLVPMEHVRQVLAAVASGHAGLGFVYATDARSSRDRVVVVFEPRSENVGPIRYPAAVLRSARNPTPARDFVHWLASSPGARRAFEDAGFEMIDGAVGREP